MNGEIILRLDQLKKAFDGTDVLHGISLEVARGEFITLLGPSGCGKTTTLRIVAGLLAPDSGRVFLGGRDVTDLAPNKRNVNTVFQNYALFPHMNVEKNIAYGLRMRSEAKSEQRAKVAEMLRLIQMSGYEKRMPAQLSGGQRQRVAVARALVLKPDLLLLDEPLGALDLKLRRQMQEELKSLQLMMGITFIYITHDQEEALNMSDRIAVMNAGKIEQIGTPEEIYERPKSRFVADFIGRGMVLDGEVVSAEGAVCRVRLSCGEALARVEDGVRPGSRVALSVHPERVLMSLEPVEGFRIPATILAHRYAGSALRTELKLSDGSTLLAHGAWTSSDLPAPGAQVSVHWDPRFAAVIADAGEVSAR